MRTPATARRLASGARIDWHRHATDQLNLPLDGVVAFMTERGTWMVPTGRAAWIPAGTPHAHVAHRRTELRSVQLAPPARPDDPHARPDDPHARPDDTARPRAEPAILAVDALVRALVLTLADDPPADLAERARLEAVLRDRLARRESHELRPLVLPEPRDDRLVRLAALLESDPGDTRTLDRLGAEIGASARTLGRLCRAELGLTFRFWRTQVRLGHALVLLSEGRTVTRTAHACGWSSASAFVAVFRDFFGTTPYAYTRALSGGQKSRKVSIWAPSSLSRSARSS